MPKPKSKLFKCELCKDIRKWNPLKLVKMEGLFVFIITKLKAMNKHVILNKINKFENKKYEHH